MKVSEQKSLSFLSSGIFHGADFFAQNKKVVV